MSRVLPARASIDVEAVHIVTACAGEFIAFLAAAVRESTSAANLASAASSTSTNLASATSDTSTNLGIEETLGALGEIG